MRYAICFLTAALIAISGAGLAADMPTATPAATPVTVTMPEAAASTSKALTDEQRQAVEDIIRDYLINKHPEVLMEAMKELQKRDQASAEEKSKAAVTAFKDKVFNDPSTPTGGNPKGDVTVVEFFDYQCGYCKMSEDSIEKLLKEDKGVRFVYKDFPILGPMSTVAARASFASIRQNKYIKFHDALMAKKDHLTEDMIYQTAKDVGLDVDKLKKDMADDETSKMIDANLKLGNDVGVRGTPMFIIGDAVFPGALQYEQLKQAVADARTKK